jgi:hypothetical protein
MHVSVRHAELLLATKSCAAAHAKKPRGRKRWLGTDWLAGRNGAYSRD